MAIEDPQHTAVGEEIASIADELGIVFADIREALGMLRQALPSRSREIACVQTKLDEARLWLGEALR